MLGKYQYILIGLLWAPVCAAAQAKWTVARDGTGRYRTVQAALDAIPCNNNQPITIRIKNGVYKEVITVDARKNQVHLRGQSKDSTILTFNHHAGTLLPNGDTLNTWTCASFFVYGNDFSASNLTFRNDAGFTAGQAVALRVEGNRAAFYDCRMVGNQDVLF